MRSFEFAHNLTLPKGGYREFLLTHNGGRSKYSNYPYTDPESKTARLSASTVHSFYSLDQHRDLNLDYAQQVRGEIVPMPYILIGFDCGGNGIALKVSGDRKGSIYHLYQSEYGDDEMPRRIFVANSFEDFARALY